MMITKAADIRPLIARGRDDPLSAFPDIRSLATSEDWQTREVAATALVEIGKRHPQAVARQAYLWAGDVDPNVRRAASEGLRGIVKTEPKLVWPVLNRLRADVSPYVGKSVANILRNASGRHGDDVLRQCRRWAAERNAHTDWIVKDGLRKLATSQPAAVEAILASMGSSGRRSE